MYTELIEQANSLRGCLHHLRTNSGRRRYADEQDLLHMESDFASDEAKLLSSKAFRLLEHKTQVVTAPLSPFIRNRKAHVMEVVADAVVIADMLGLNRNLARAIALGHDIGHVPFGHPGEHFLAKHMGRKEFCHEILAPLIAQRIERGGKGLNLTYETLEGMMCHSGSMAREGMTQEAWVVRYVDKIAYIFADYNDITKRMGYPLPSALQSLMNEFGPDHRHRTTVAMAGLITESAEVGKVSFEVSELGVKFKELRNLMMEVYTHVTQQNLHSLMEPVLTFLGELDIGDPYLLFSLLTDRDVMCLASQPARNITHLKDTALAERMGYLKDIGQLDLCDPYLDW